MLRVVALCFPYPSEANLTMSISIPSLSQVQDPTLHSYPQLPVESIVQPFIKSHKEDLDTKAYFLVPEEDPPKISRKSRLRDKISKASSPLKTLYEYRGKKQVAHYVEKIGDQLLREDGTVDEAERARLEKALNDKLLEKISHYDEEGRRYLKIYSGAAGTLILIIVGGTLITSTVASGGYLVLPATGAAVGVAATTALIGAVVTAILFAYRVDAKRNFVIKGVAKVKLRQYQNAQQHKLEREVGRLMANIALDKAIFQATGQSVDDCNIRPSKRQVIENTLLQSLIQQERKTSFLRKWSKALMEEARSIAANPPPDLCEYVDTQVELGMELILDQVDELDESTAEFTRHLLKQACTYQLAKLEAASRMLVEPASAFSDLIAPHLVLDPGNSKHVRCKSHQVIKTFQSVLGAPDKDLETEVCQLKHKNQWERKKRKKMERQFIQMQQSLATQQQQIEQLQQALLSS